MRFNHHSPSHWIAVALVLVLGLFSFEHAGGQAPGDGPGFQRQAAPQQALASVR